ncbi:hypothetical protein H6775_03850 [Candidatus Nomurabacteria bacterium]|nr:hypothetical protein [Candidatus Nomurabacteria bacterium]
MQNTDKIEGKGANVTTGIGFTTEAEALNFVNSEYSRKFGIYGGKLGEWSIRERNFTTPVKIYGNIEEYLNGTAKVKEQVNLVKKLEVLAKDGYLSDEQVKDLKKILGSSHLNETDK